MNSSRWFDLVNRLDGFDLTTTLSHGTDSTGSAKMHGFGSKIRVLLTQATAGKAVSATINTPVAFRVIGMAGQSVSDTSGMKVLTAYNTTTAIATVSVATAEIARAVAMDQSQATFAVDEDDLLVVISGSSAGSAIVILDIIFT